MPSCFFFYLCLAASPDLPEAKVLFAGNKTFYFDVGSNRYGVFLRISELRANYRTAVTIPEHHWPRFRDILGEIAGKLEEAKLAAPEPAAANGTQEVKDVGTPASKPEAVVEKPAVNLNLFLNRFHNISKYLNDCKLNLTLHL